MPSRAPHLAVLQALQPEQSSMAAISPTEMPGVTVRRDFGSSAFAANLQVGWLGVPGWAMGGWPAAAMLTVCARPHHS